MTARPSIPPTNWWRVPDLTMAEAARVLNCSKSHVYALAEAGSLSTHRDDLGRLRVRPADLEALVAAQVAEADAQADLFAPEDAVAAVAQWLASVADPDGVIRNPQAVAMIQAALTDE